MTSIWQACAKKVPLTAIPAAMVALVVVVVVGWRW